jgi:hypothetical protein
MGLSKGHTFTDGETVTAAKLNNLVDNATITSDTITEAMIKDGAVTANKLAANSVTGANISSNSINLTSLSNASGGTSGTIVQSGAGGVFEEFTPGTSGTFLKSAGTDASLTWGTVDATGVDATMISGHTEITSPGTDDTLLIKDKTAGVNKSLQIQNLYKTVSGLTALSSADIASSDEFLVIDGTIPKKITKANLESALGGGQLPSSGSNYYSGTSSTLYDVLNSASKTAVFTHGLGATPRLVRMVVLCDSDDSLGHGYSVGDEIEIANLYYWDGDNYQTPAATVTSDSSTIQAQFNYLITASGFQLVLMQKTQIPGGPAQGSAGGPGTLNFGTAYYFSNKSGADTSRFKLKVYAWA